jgi:FtsP/CotA-like multicopper oxidase with cupredoxin domain
MRIAIFGLALCLSLSWTDDVAAGQAAPATRATGLFAEANNNRNAAGTLANGILTLRLVAEESAWQPEGPEGRTLTVQAFREETGRPMVPGPLVRVPAGTVIHVSIRNSVPGTTLSVFGMRTRPATGANAPMQIPAGETREAKFLAGEPGTYHYWATTMGRPLVQRTDVDSQLGGAFVVDPPGARVDDRIFVVGIWHPPGSPPAVGDIGVINGRSWPLTDTLDYRVGDTVRWRVVNLAYDQHAMHLHGMYFRILSNGEGRVSRAYGDADQPLVVTEHVAPGETFEMQWTPERPGNWLFHCHMTAHMSPPPGSPVAAHQHATDSGGMAGLVVGIRVAGTESAPVATAGAAMPVRRLTMRMREEPNRYGARPGYRVELEGIDAPRLSARPLPGPVLVLTRGQPVEVELVNEMRDPTAIHWHGIELESYFDGVPGWGGTVGSTTPPVESGGRFTARFTPPRAGTFIYHTHWHDEAQLAGGLYGALIVLEPGARYDPATDHVYIAGYDGLAAAGQREPVVVNGMAATVPALPPGPTAMPLRGGVANRLRLINITPNNVALTFVLTDGFKQVAWRPLAKDGADLPPQQRGTREALQLVSVGETYDFEILPAPGQRLWLELRRGNGEWMTQTLLVAVP